MDNLIFLPGLGCDERVFAPMLKDYEADFNSQVICYQPFHNIEQHVQHILSDAPATFILIGHSLGGWLAQWIAIQAPKRVARLIIMGSGAGKFNSELANIYHEMMSWFHLDKAEEFLNKMNPFSPYPFPFKDFYLNNLARNIQESFPLQGVIKQVKAELKGMDTTPHLHKIKSRTLLVHGKQDPFFAAEMKVLRKGIPRNTYIEIDQCGHMIPLEHPGFMSSVIKSWIMED